MLVYLSPDSFVMLGRAGNTCEEQKNDKVAMVIHLNQTAKSIREYRHTDLHCTRIIIP